jgi:hypothetical protein
MIKTTVLPTGNENKLSEADLMAEVRALRQLTGQLMLVAAPARAGDFDSILAKLSLTELGTRMWTTRGRRSCLRLRTLFSQWAEQEDGRRARGRGRDLV